MSDQKQATTVAENVTIRANRMGAVLNMRDKSGVNRAVTYKVKHRKNGSIALSFAVTGIKTRDFYAFFETSVVDAAVAPVTLAIAKDNPGAIIEY